MTNTQKRRPVMYAKELTIRCPDQAFEAMIKEKIAQTGLPSNSAAIRYLLETRRVDTRIVKFSLDDTMWILSDIQKELQLLPIDIMQIKKKLTAISIMHARGNIVDTQLFDGLKAQLAYKTKNIIDTIAKLSYLWLPK